MLRLMLIRHGATAAVRAAAFGANESLEPAARSAAAALANRLPPHPRGFTGPERACVETAAALSLDAEVRPELAGADMGRWRGLSLEEVQGRDLDGLMSWMTDPAAAPHGGESVADCGVRVAGWLARLAAGETEGFVVGCVDAAVIKSAVCHALGAPAEAFWRIDVAPLGVTELHWARGRWTLRRVNAGLESAEPLR